MSCHITSSNLRSIEASATEPEEAQGRMGRGGWRGSVLHPAAWALLVSGGCKHRLEGEEKIAQESLASGTHRKDGALHQLLDSRLLLLGSSFFYRNNACSLERAGIHFGGVTM